MITIFWKALQEFKLKLLSRPALVLADLNACKILSFFSVFIIISVICITSQCKCKLAGKIEQKNCKAASWTIGATFIVLTLHVSVKEKIRLARIFCEVNASFFKENRQFPWLRDKISLKKLLLSGFRASLSLLPNRHEVMKLWIVGKQNYDIAVEVLLVATVLATPTDTSMHAHLGTLKRFHFELFGFKFICGLQNNVRLKKKTFSLQICF